MTVVLDLDCGNSRTKWRCERDQGSVSPGCIPRLDLPVERVRVSSVSVSRENLRSEICRTYGVEPEFAESLKTLAGVTNSYSNPEELGVDRWLAMVAAWNRVRASVMVVDAGTAITIDILDNTGHHLGGYIVPGLESMRKSLAIDTASVQIGSCSETIPNGSLGINTVQAVRNGLLSMVVAWIDQTRSLAEEICGSVPTTFVVGGDKKSLMGLIDYDCRTEDELVLDGLGLALP